MALPHCPRCDLPLKKAGAMHWRCVLARARVWVGVFIVLIIGGLGAAGWFTFPLYEPYIQSLVHL